MNDISAQRTAPPPPSAGTGDRYIPVRFRAYSERLLADFRQDTNDEVADQLDAERLRDAAELIDEVVRQEADGFRQSLLEHYEGVNPDRPAGGGGDAAGDVSARNLLSDIAYVFERAGFEVITAEMFAEAVSRPNASGVELHVDFSPFEHVMMFGRGRAEAPVAGLGFLALYEKTVVVPVYQRLAVVLQRKGDPGIHIRMFRDIPLSDLEAVLPGAGTRMRPADRFWLATTVLSAGYALLNAIGGDDLGSFELSPTAAKALSLAAVLGAYRVYYYYTVLRDLATGRLNKQLYYQQLNGNVGLLSHLIDEVAQQEANMILTAYLFLLRCDRKPADQAELDRLVEFYLHRAFARPINFDVATATAGLARLRLAGPGPAPSVVDVHTAEVRLREHLVSRLTRNHHAAAAAAPRRWVDIIPRKSAAERRNAQRPNV
jgi:hypothetical protein